MKKFVVVLLALALVFGLATTAMAADTQVSFPDVSNQSKAAQTGIYRLATLGVLEGYEDGTFRPSGNITRAEFAKICDYLADKVGAISTFDSMTSAFSDVKVGSWYNGYVIAAYEYNLVKGYTDGTFGPQRNITLAEAVTMLLRVVGYTDELSGDWPYDYIAAAKDLDVIDDIDFVSNRIATRAEIAIMANAILDLAKVQYDPDSITVLVNRPSTVRNQDKSYKYLANNAIYTTISNAKDFVALGYDLLEGSFDAFTAEVHFKDGADIFREGAAWGYEKFKDGELEMIACEYPHDRTCDYDVYGVNDKYYIQGGKLVDLGGQIATITYTGNPAKDHDAEICFVELTGSVVKSYALKKDGDTGVKADDVKYAKSTDYAYMDRVDFDADSYGMLYLDEDGNWIGMKDYHVPALTDVRFGIVSKVNDNWIEFNQTQHVIANIALNDKYGTYLDKGFVFIKDGEFIKASDVKVGDVIYQGKLSDGDVTYFLVYSPLQGNVKKYRQDYFITMNDDHDYDAHYGYYGTNGVDGKLTWLNHVNSLNNDVFKSCQYAIAYAYNGLAYVIGDYNDAALGVIVDALTRANGLSIYDIISGLTSSNPVSGIASSLVKTIVLFGEDGEEHEYTFSDKYDFADFVADVLDQADDAGYDPNVLHVLGSLVTLSLNSDGQINGVDLEVFFDPQDPAIANSVSGHYVKHGTDPKQYLNDDATIFRINAKVVRPRLYSGASLADASASLVVTPVNAQKARVEDSTYYVFDSVKLVKASSLLKGDFMTKQYAAYDTAESGSSIDGLYIVNSTSRYARYGVAENEYQDANHDKVLEMVDDDDILIDNWLYPNWWGIGQINYPLLMFYWLDDEDLLYGLGIADEDGLVPQIKPGYQIPGSAGQFQQYVGSSSIASVGSNGKHIVFNYDNDNPMGASRTFEVTSDTKFYDLAKDKAMTYEDLMTSKQDPSAWYVYIYEPALDATDCELLYVVKVNAPNVLLFGDYTWLDGQYTWSSFCDGTGGMDVAMFGGNAEMSGDGTLVIDWDNRAIQVVGGDVTIKVHSDLNLSFWNISCAVGSNLHFVLDNGTKVTMNAWFGDVHYDDFDLIPASSNPAAGTWDWAVWTIL
ncbi:MAG: S-layer homology domain-containing protein [Firmicutes bacterium]|nr:S-layer homology domain-containing protein [Bacillota bacterium]